MMSFKTKSLFWMLKLKHLVFELLGYFIILWNIKKVEPFNCTHEESRPNVKFTNEWVDSIWGNKEDGLDGDKPYKQKFSELTLWTRYNWTAIRNSIHNMALTDGVHEKIIDFVLIGDEEVQDRIGKEGEQYSIAYGESGRKYEMYRKCKISPTATKIARGYYKIKSMIFGSEYDDKRQYGLEYTIGYKNINVNRNELNKFYEYSFTISWNPIKKFEY